MRLNIIKYQYRNLRKNPVPALINLIGLSAGIAVAFLMISFIHHEMTYEQYHDRADRIYRINLGLTIEGDKKIVAVSPNILGPRMDDQIPEVESYVRMLYPINATPVLQVEENFFKERSFYVSDSSLFGLFDFSVIHGTKEGLLTRPEDAFISRTTALKFYGTAEATGKTFKDSYDKDFVVRAVFEDHPPNSHFQPEIIVSSVSTDLTGELTWGQSNYFTYILLRKGADPAEVERKIEVIVQNEADDWMKQMGSVFSLEPVKDIHLYSDADFSQGTGGDIKDVYASITIVLFILILACVNYINLTTSRSFDRAREVGIKKMMGRTWRKLFFDFLFESFIITGISFLIAVVIVYLIYPYFEQITATGISFDFLKEPASFVIILAAWLLLSLAAGAYPAVVLANFRPALVLKGSFKKSKYGVTARKTMVVFQFIISICLIIGTLVVYKQIDFLNRKDLGFDKDHVLVLPMTRIPDQAKLQGLKNTLLQHNNIREVSFSSAYPTRNSGGQLLKAEGMADNEQMLIWEWRVDENILNAFGMNLVAGRNFNAETAGSDEKDFILNQMAARQIGWDAEEAVGRRIDVSGTKGIVVGVVEDFHFTSLKNTVEPLVLNIKSSYRNNVVIRLAGGRVESTLEFIRQSWNEHITELIFDYQFLDNEFDKLYKNEYRTGKMFSGFSILAIIIAGLGLFGLSTYETQTRIKEIGIRKAMGSTTLGVFKLLMRNFLLLILYSFLISIPLAYFIMDQWLREFAFRISPGLREFLFSGLIVFAIVFVSVGYRSLKAAFLNPAESLRYE